MREIVIQLLQSPMAKQTCGNIDFQPLQLCACLQTTQSSGRSKGKAKSALWKSCMLKTTVAFKNLTNWALAVPKNIMTMLSCTSKTTLPAATMLKYMHRLHDHIDTIGTHCHESPYLCAHAQLYKCNVTFHALQTKICVYTYTHQKKTKNVPLTVSAPLLSHAGHVHMSKPNPKKKKKRGLLHCTPTLA